MRIRLPGARAFARLRDAIAEHWLSRRVPRESTRIRLHRRRLFILPTRLGYTLAATLALLLLGSLNYGSSLGFALTFLLAGAGAQAMIHTYRNLEGLELVFATPAPVFAGETLRLPVRLRAGPPMRWGITLEGADGPDGVHSSGPDTVGQGAYTFETTARGRFRPPRLRVATTWPYGLLRVWSWIWPGVEGLVYPACIDHGIPPPERPASDGLHRPRAGGDEDFAGLRDYRPGDSPRRIAWQAYARTGALLVKSFESTPAGDHWFDWTTLDRLAPEARLEQMCHWVIEAERHGQRYGLALPDRRIDAGHGPAHKARCLEALALVGQRDPVE